MGNRGKGFNKRNTHTRTHTQVGNDLLTPLQCDRKVCLAVSAMLPLAKQCAFEEPSVETITGENVLTWPYVVSR